MIPPRPADEDARLEALGRYRLEGIGQEAAFDHMAELAARLFDVPMSFVSIVGSERQCLRGQCGIDIGPVSRDAAFCSFTILGDTVLVAQDTRDDARFRDNPFVTGTEAIRFYAGAPLKLRSGAVAGALCIADRRPREFGEQDSTLLADLARTVVDMIELRVERFAAEDHRRALAEERALFRLTVDNLSEGVALYDEDMRLSIWNEPFARMFAHLPVAIEQGISAESLTVALAERGELGPGRAGRITAEVMGSIRAEEDRVVEIALSDGRILDARRQSVGNGRFVVAVRDVTDERQAARLKDELVSTVSHELRTPLTAISGALRLITGGAAGELPGRAVGLIDIGLRNAERLSDLVDDLLDMDKLQAGKLSFSFAPHDLAALLREATEQNQPFADRFSVALELALPDDAPVVAMVDRTRLFQVITNLISNATKFSPEGGTVRIALSQEGAVARIAVSDDGPGVAPGFRKRLFARFAQDEAPQHARHRGTGLGLAISKAIVDAHEGTIALADGDPPGATFVVELPSDPDRGASS